MKRVLAAAALCLCCAAGPSIPDSWQGMTSWIGKYPTDDTATPTRHLLGESPIAEVLHTVLQPEDEKRLDSFETESRISTIAGLLVVKQCLPHDCGAHSATIVVDPRQHKLYVGFYVNDRGVTSTRWFGNADPDLLPAAIRFEFIRQHTPNFRR